MRGCIPISERIVRWNSKIEYLGYIYDIGADGYVYRKKIEGEKWERTNLRCRYKGKKKY